MTGTIEPVVVAVEVRRGVEEAFGVFTSEIASWWPVADHSVEADKVEAVVLEGRVGGRLYERWRDGGEADWGRVVTWEPPRRLDYLWHLRADRSDATDVSQKAMWWGASSLAACAITAGNSARRCISANSRSAVSRLTSADAIVETSPPHCAMTEFTRACAYWM